MRLLLALAILLATIAGHAVMSSAALAAGEKCLIADPKDTSLNVRDAPAGKLVNRLRNGREVVIQELGFDDRARKWARVSGYYKGVWRDWGWVFHRYLDCAGPPDAVPVQSASFPLVFGRAEEMRPLGMVLANYGPDGFNVKRLPNRCHYYGDGGNDISISDSLLQHYQARGFSQNSLCMALAAPILFDPETGERLPSYIVVDVEVLRAGMAEAGTLSEELPLDVPSCFARALPYTDCVFNYDPLTGVKLSAKTRDWYKAAGKRIVAALQSELASGQFSQECTCKDVEDHAKDCRREKMGACPDEQYVVGMLAREFVSYSAPQEAWVGFYDISPNLPFGFGYSIHTDGSAGPSGALGSEKLILSGKNRATKARIQSVLNARQEN